MNDTKRRKSNIKIHSAPRKRLNKIVIICLLAPSSLFCHTDYNTAKGRRCAMRHIQAELRVLSDGEIEQIHEASVQILSKIGLHVPNAQVCRAAAALGAKTDGATVRIPAEALAPIFADARAGRHPFPKAGHTVRKITGNVSTQVFTYDYSTGTRRRGTLQDVRDGIALIEGLPNIPRSGAVVLPSDVPLPDVMCYR